MPKVNVFEWPRPPRVTKAIELRDPIRRPGVVISLTIKRFEGNDDDAVSALFKDVVKRYITGWIDENGKKFEPVAFPPFGDPLETLTLTTLDSDRIWKACAFSIRQVVDHEDDRYSPEEWIIFSETAKLIYLGMDIECQRLEEQGQDDGPPNSTAGGTGGGSPSLQENGTNDTPNLSLETTPNSTPSTSGSDSSAAGSQDDLG